MQRHRISHPLASAPQAHGSAHEQARPADEAHTCTLGSRGGETPGGVPHGSAPKQARTARRPLSPRAARAFALVLAVALAICCSVPAAFAADAGMHGKTATLGRDLVGAGADLSFTTSDAVEGNIFAAASNISLDSASAAGDMALAAQSIHTRNAQVGNNLYAAGGTVSADATVKGWALVAGQDVKLAGDMEHVVAAADKVEVSGAYKSMELHADEVVVQAGTSIEGTLEVYAPAEPSVASGAKVDNIEFHATEKEDAGAGAALAAALAWLDMAATIASALAAFVCGVLLLVCLGARPFECAAANLRTRTARVLVAGLVTCLLVPAVVLALALLVLGAWAALALFLAAGALSTIALPFTAICIGRAVFPRMNKWGSSAIMLAVFAVAAHVPFLGIVVGLFCSLFAAGSVVVAFIDWRRGGAGGANGAGDGGKGGSPGGLGTPNGPGGQGAPNGPGYPNALGAPGGGYAGEPDDGEAGGPWQPGFSGGAGAAGIERPCPDGGAGASGTWQPCPGGEGAGSGMMVNQLGAPAAPGAFTPTGAPAPAEAHAADASAASGAFTPADERAQSFTPISVRAQSLWRQQDSEVPLGGAWPRQAEDGSWTQPAFTAPAEPEGAQPQAKTEAHVQAQPQAEAQPQPQPQPTVHEADAQNPAYAATHLPVACADAPDNAAAPAAHEAAAHHAAARRSEQVEAILNQIKERQRRRENS